ncbi:MAG: outer membrane beta-barrel protein, partial [bacterium]|nr:outer membrane beta-barrel protein [bacterium]
ISVEVNYIQKGILDAYVIINPLTYEILGMEELKHRLDYLSIPVHIKIYKKGEVFSPYLLFGPRFDYLFNYRSDVYDLLFDEVNNFVLVFNAGIGADLLINSNLKGTFELRYNWDITVSEDTFDSRNKAFQVRIGFRFPGKFKCKN